MPAHLAASAMKEVTNRSSHGVDIQTVNLKDAGRDGAVRLVVVLASRPFQHLPSDALGSIQFRADVPDPVPERMVGVAGCRETAALQAAGVDTRFLSAWWDIVALAQSADIPPRRG
jgi:hypothetical protein